MTPELKLRWKAFQKKIGVEADGDPGNLTLTRIEELFEKLDLPEKKADPVVVLPDKASVPVKTPTLHPEVAVNTAGLVISQVSLDELVDYEIGGTNYYEKVLSKPTWPGWSSGVTIGIGYDLGYNTKEEIESDWGGLVTDSDLKKLTSVAGVTASAASRSLHRVSGIKIPLDVARKVFAQVTLSKFAALTLGAFKGVYFLPPDAQGALLSLVFNRGSSMDPHSSRRREMREIRDIILKLKGKDSVSQDTLDDISSKIREMKRLWSSGGLLPRRDSEAKRVKGSRRPYDTNELIIIPLDK
jgi:hypothetical protein